MAQAEKILDKAYSQDLYTAVSPLELTGFNGDEYDYEFIIRATNGGANQNLYMQLNVDTGSNYRSYYMNGASTTASGGVTDTGTYISLTNPTVATDTFLKFNITGSSGDERYIDMIIGSSAGSAIIKTGAYWKNTANEFSSIKFFNIYSATTDLHIIIYRTPKVASQSSWELMEKLSWSDATALALNGSTEYLNCGNDSSLILTDNLMYNIWVYPTSLAAIGTIIARWGGTGSRAFVLELLTDGTITATFSSDGTANVGHTSVFTIPINQWTMVSVRLTGGTVYLSKNADTEESFSQAAFFAGTPNTTIGALLNPSAIQYFTGSMSNATILNSGTDVRSSLYNSGIPKQPGEYSQTIQDSYALALPINSGVTVGTEFDDLSGNGNDATAFGGAAVDGEVLPYLAEKSFTVNGDSDIKYKIEWSGNQELNLELNNDTTTYTRQYLQNSSGTISAANSTSETSIVSDGINSTFIINAETGVKRLVTTSASNTSSAQQSEMAHWYDDTATNLTSLDCTPAAIATGTAKLYRLKNPNGPTGDTLPFETVQNISVSGDYSAGTTISNLAGNSHTLIKVEGHFSTIGNELRIQLAGDTGANYDEQELKAATSTASATSVSSANYWMLADASSSKVASFELYIYPKDGENRPALLINRTNENQLEFKALWWNDTATDLDSLKIYTSSTTTTTGNIKVSRLK